MKYTFIILLLASSILVIPYSIRAAEDRQPKTVSGKVRYPDLSLAKNIHVSVTCKTTTLFDETSINGNYSVTFGDMECEQFNTAVVTIDTGTYSGIGSREITFALGQALPDIILTEVTSESPTPTGEVPVSVPEFGTLSAIIASSSSLLAFSKLRKFL